MLSLSYYLHATLSATIGRVRT